MCAADTRPRALVVEDQPDTRATLGLLLEMSGYEVRLAANGAEGVRIALSWQPDAIVSDIGLPIMDGYELARQVRAAIGSGPLLVAVTGYSQPTDRDAALAAGFDHHFAKPADPANLLALLKAVRPLE
jgi:CheY-like chemotaxis protein